MQVPDLAALLPRKLYVSMTSAAKALKVEHEAVRTMMRQPGPSMREMSMR